MRRNGFLPALLDDAKAMAERYRWIVANPESARHLLRLLQQRKGDEEAFAKMIDRIITSENAARSRANVKP
jgi:predicted Fe-S protein YdhL (DUF1289 family)